MQHPKLELGVKVGAVFGSAHKQASIIKIESPAQSKLKMFEVGFFEHSLAEAAMCGFLEFVLSYSSKVTKRMGCWAVDL